MINLFKTKPAQPDWCSHIGGIDYRLNNDFRWESGRKGSGEWVVIPEGFEFQSSVPWWLRWFVSPHRPDLLLAAMLHDYFLEKGYSKAFSSGQWADGARKADAPKWIWFLGHTAVSWWTFPEEKWDA